jgi:hypothetical protein
MMIPIRRLKTHLLIDNDQITTFDNPQHLNHFSTKNKLV